MLNELAHCIDSSPEAFFAGIFVAMVIEFNYCLFHFIDGLLYKYWWSRKKKRPPSDGGQ